MDDGFRPHKRKLARFAVTMTVLKIKINGSIIKHVQSIS